MARPKRLLLLLFLALAGILLVTGRLDAIPMLVMLGSIYLGLRVVTGPLSRFIARRGFSIRWKILVAVSLIAVLFALASLINFGAMQYMHDELHTIQDLAESQPWRVIPAVDRLESNQHGLLFGLTPFLTMLGALVALGLGLALAWSVIDPVRRMGQAMRRIASGDFSEPVQIENKDELGELASRINQTAQELARLHEATVAEERTRALRDRFTQVTLAQEEERRRISRELHDGLGPSLAAMGNRLRACRFTMRTDPERAERELEEIAVILRGHVQEIRELIHGLRPLALDQVGLVGALKQQLERFRQDTGIEASLGAEGEIVLEPVAEGTIFRVVQECLSNVQKHAHASQVEVTLRSMDSALELRVADNGRGFGVHDPAAANGKGLGLLSMRERAELLGGSLSVQSGPGSGCQVVLRIPLREVKVGAHTGPAGG